MTQPEIRFKVGACTAAVFANQVNAADGVVQMKSVSLQRTYRDRDGKFQNTSSFGANDIPKAILALTKAYDYVMAEKGVD